MSTNFADNLRRARREAGLTGQHLAKTLGVAPDTVSRWMRGRAAPGSARLARLAELLHVSTDELLADAKASPRQPIPILGRVTAGPTAPQTVVAGQTIRLDVAGLRVTITVEPVA
jgi:transcriptional regulator with XRE-family HTH domain